MACHEIAALRLSLMNLLGVKDEAVLAHELAELGMAAEQPGPVRSLARATDFAAVEQAYDMCLSDLEAKLSQMSSNDPQRPYYQTLVVLNKKVECELRNYRQSLHNFYQDLEEVHDHMHAIYPISDEAGV